MWPLICSGCWLQSWKPSGQRCYISVYVRKSQFMPCCQCSRNIIFKYHLQGHLGDVLFSTLQLVSCRCTLLQACCDSVVTYLMNEFLFFLQFSLSNFQIASTSLVENWNSAWQKLHQYQVSASEFGVAHSLWRSQVSKYWRMLGRREGNCYSDNHGPWGYMYKR